MNSGCGSLTVTQLACTHLEHLQTRTPGVTRFTPEADAVVVNRGRLRRLSLSAKTRTLQLGSVPPVSLTYRVS